jgi:hypothetical protein
MRKVADPGEGMWFGGRDTTGRPGSYASGHP